MECQKCQFEISGDHEYCGHCGARLEKVCPECCCANPRDFNFCGRCGGSLNPASPKRVEEMPVDEKLAKIARYLPKGITEKILARRDKIEGEKKQITVMFCDMEGYTRFADSCGPEETYNFMDQVYEILIESVHHYGGTVNEMTGDGIVALFGAPISLEDAPQRAIRAALSIQKKMIGFSEKAKRVGKKLPVKMRIGINTGLVVVGTLGNDLRVEFKAVGNTVNMAARMEEIAEPGTIYVTADTYRLAEGFFQFENLGEKKVKGREAPVSAYRVIVPFRGRTRFDVNAERGLTPFVDRELEQKLLFDCFERAKNGRGQTFSIVAEAGVGKSRLLFEFRKAVANEAVTFLDGRCLSYGKSMAYHPIIDILKSIFGILEEDDATAVENRIKDGLKSINVNEASVLPYLLELLSVRESGIDRTPMSPEARKERILEALKKITLQGAEIRPVIISIEDLHWIDNSSEECLKYFMESLSGAAVFLIFTYRPEFSPTWGIRSYYHHQVILDRLSDGDSTTMISNFLGSEDMDEPLEKLILEKTEGVPFFIEEFIKSFRDLAIIERKKNYYKLSKKIKELKIPSTIQDVIMTRVDRLPEKAKEILQTGAAIEREFGCDLIMRVMGISETELSSHLSILKDSELLYEKGIFPGSTIVFMHALTREVVYESILTRKKETLHEKIAKSIIDLYPENIDEHYGVLAEHFIAGGNYKMGAEYSRLTAKKYEKAASLTEAIRYTKKRIASLDKLPLTEKIEEKIIDARIALALYYLQFNFHVEAKTAVDPIFDAAIKQDCRKRISQINIILGTYNYLSREDFPEAFKQLNQALKISEESKDAVTLFFSNHFLGLALSFNCEFDRALHCYEKALQINTATHALWGIAAMKCMISYFVYFSQGRIDLSYQTSREALELAEESGDIYSKALAHTSHGISCYGKGFAEDAKTHLERGIALCERIDLFYWNAMAQATLGDAYFEGANYGKSMEHHGHAVSLLENNQMIPFWTSVNKMGLARAKVLKNEKEVNIESLTVLAEMNKVKIADGWMKRYIGEILLNMGDDRLPEAAVWITGAIEADTENNMRFNLGKDYALNAKFNKRMGDFSTSEENRKKAVGILKECGVDADRFV